MMLKIRDGLTWVFLDEIVRIRVYDSQIYHGEPTGTGGIQIEEGENKTRAANYFNGYYGILCDGHPHKACEIFLKLSSGAEKVLLVGSDIYLLNDEGQTVERFTP